MQSTERHPNDVADLYGGRCLAPDPVRPDGWVVYDLAGRVVRSSTNYCAMLAEVTGRHFGDRLTSQLAASE